MLPKNVKCVTCAWIQQNDRHTCKLHLRTITMPDCEWCAYWQQKGKFEIESGRLVVKEQSESERDTEDRVMSLEKKIASVERLMRRLWTKLDPVSVEMDAMQRGDDG